MVGEPVEIGRDRSETPDFRGMGRNGGQTLLGEAKAYTDQQLRNWIGRVRVTLNGSTADVAARHRLNFIGNWRAADNPTRDAVDIGGSAAVFVYQLAGAGGAALVAGSDLDADVPLLESSGLLLTGWKISANTPGSLTVDIQKATFGPSPSFASIVGGNPPVLSSQQTNSDAVLTGWTTGIAADDILRFRCTAASGIARATLTLRGDPV